MTSRNPGRKIAQVILEFFIRTPPIACLVKHRGLNSPILVAEASPFVIHIQQVHGKEKLLVYGHFIEITKKNMSA